MPVYPLVSKAAKNKAPYTACVRGFEFNYSTTFYNVFLSNLIVSKATIAVVHIIALE